MLVVSLALAADAPAIPYERYELPNGLQVILVEDHRLPSVCVDIWYRVGSKDELPGRSGFAHLFEHLMFMGTHRLPGSGFDQVMEAHGGWNNAWTMEDATNYYEVGPPGLLETFLWMEADRMQALDDAMTQEKLDLQRDVVRNERRQSNEDRPYGMVEIELTTALYPEGHPYAHSVIGSHEDLQAASVTDVTSFFQTWYVPNNASLVVAGDFSSAAVKPVIEKYFSVLQRKELPTRWAGERPSKPQKPLVTITDQVEYPQLNLAWHSPAKFQPGDAEMELVADLLAGGESSRLYRRLVDSGLAQDVSVFQYGIEYGGIFYLSALPMDGVSVDQLDLAVREELARLANEPPTALEMERLRNQRKLARYQELEPLQNRAETLNRYWAYTGTPDWLANDVARFASAKPEALSAAVAQYLKPELATKIVVNPEPAAASAGGGVQVKRALVLVLAALAAGPAVAKSKKAPEPEPAPVSVPPPDPLAERPPVAPPGAFVPPTPAAGTLSNGAGVWTVVNDALPLFTVVLSVPGGSSLDPAGKEGTSALGVECMQRGAGSRDAEDFASEVERRGLSLTVGTGADGSYAVLSGTTDQLEPGLDLLADMVMRPRLAGADVKKARELLLAGLASSMDEPAYVADRTAQWLYWGKDHPYGRPGDGTAAGLARAGRGDVKRWHRAAWHAAGARFTVVGAVEPAKVEAALEARFGAPWKAGKRPEVVVPAAPVHDREPIYLVDAPGSSQTGFYLAFPGLPVGHELAAPTRVGTIALGGTFTSRLNSLLREKRGYTYGVRAALDDMLHGGALLVRTRIRADVTGAALVDLVGELQGIRKGITAEELGKAQGAFRQDVVESMETVSATALTFSRLHEAGRAPGSLAADLASVASVGIDAVAPTMAPYDPARAVIVLVGDVKNIEPQLRAAGFDKLSVVVPP